MAVEAHKGWWILTASNEGGKGPGTRVQNRGTWAPGGSWAGSFL